MSTSQNIKKFYKSSTKSDKAATVIAMEENKFTFIDLFAGIGGTRLGFEAAGGKCLLTSEIDEYALKTYKANFKDRDDHIYQNDIKKIKLNLVPDHDILVAGFPCQPYSIAGLRKGLLDERGEVFNYIIKIIKKKKPKAFLLENVKGILSHDNGETFKYLKKLLSNIGYSVTHMTLNTMEYTNIPQNRERVFIIGFLEIEKYNNFKFPDKIKLDRKIGDMLEKGKIDKKYIYDERYPMYSILKEKCKNKNSVYQWRRHYVRENKSGVCPTLTANMGSGGHNVPLVYQKNKIRKLTPRECANFQGFPSNYILPSISDARLYHQMGNSVTVPLIKVIAEKMVQALR